MKIYFAGPLFTLAERRYNNEMTNHLRTLGHVVWLPQERASGEKTSSGIFRSNCQGLTWCEVLIANIDGTGVDDGTSWAIGHVWKKKPIILFKTDLRQTKDLRKSCNIMLAHSADRIIYMPDVASPSLVAQEIALALDEIIKGPR